MRKSMLLLPLWLWVGGTASAQLPISLPLTPQQVTCEEQQAGRLIHRVSVAYLGSSLFLWRSSPQGGAYRGLVGTNDMRFITVQGDRFRQEQQLAFDLILRRGDDFLDPRRPLLPEQPDGSRLTTGCIEFSTPGTGLYVLPPLRPGVEVQGEAVFRRNAPLFAHHGEHN